MLNSSEIDLGIAAGFAVERSDEDRNESALLREVLLSEDLENDPESVTETLDDLLGSFQLHEQSVHACDEFLPETLQDEVGRNEHADLLGDEAEIRDGRDLLLDLLDEIWKILRSRGHSLNRHDGHCMFPP